MPRIYYRLLNNAEITVWSANEKTDFYRDYLKVNNFPISAAEVIKNKEKQRQWYVSRYVLSQSYPEAIQYYSNQKPVLMNGPRISLSHSKNEVAIMFSHGEGGIDIQWPEKKLLRIAEKYVLNEDLNTLDGLSKMEAHTLIWSVKEAIFKFYGTGVAFKSIRLTKYDPVHNTVHSEVSRPERVVEKILCADFINEMAIAYILE